MNAAISFLGQQGPKFISFAGQQGSKLFMGNSVVQAGLIYLETHHSKLYSQMKKN